MEFDGLKQALLILSYIYLYALCALWRGLCGVMVLCHEIIYCCPENSVGRGSGGFAGRLEFVRCIPPHFTT